MNKQIDRAAEIALLSAVALEKQININSDLIRLIDVLRSQLNNTSRHDLYELATDRLNRLEEEKEASLLPVAEFVADALATSLTLRNAVRAKLAEKGLAV